MTLYSYVFFFFRVLIMALWQWPYQVPAREALKILAIVAFGTVAGGSAVSSYYQPLKV